VIAFLDELHRGIDTSPVATHSDQKERLRRFVVKFLLENRQGSRSSRSA
jgi:hypothetical protein